MYERHVSRHLEELALFYLPRTETDEEDSDKETDETDGEAAGVSSDEAFQKTTNSQALFIMKQLLESNNPPSIDSLPQANSELKKDPRGTIDHLNQLLYQDVEDSDNESLDSLHSMPAGQDLPDPAPDHLFLRTRESSWKLRFAAFSISEGVLKVGEIRTEAAKILRVSRELIILIYKGQILSDDQTPCNAMGIKHQSELFCVTSEADTSSTMDFLDLPDIPNSGESHNLPETPRDKSISSANFSDNYIPASAEEQVKATAADNLDKTAKGTEKRKPIEFKDALGRKFSFPFELCATWQVCFSPSNMIVCLLRIHDRGWKTSFGRLFSILNRSDPMWPMDTMILPVLMATLSFHKSGKQ
jgi:hypothetical protein